MDLEKLEFILASEAEPGLVSVMLANNETGVIQPVADVVRLSERFWFQGTLRCGTGYWKNSGFHG